MENSKKGKRNRVRKSLFSGAKTSFDIMGGTIETRRNLNIDTSWYNVGVFYIRAMDNISVERGLNRRFLEEGELDTY